MKCFQCEKGKMLSGIADMTAHVRGEDVAVRTEAMVCDRCGFHVLTDEQSDAYTIAGADAYREKHRLLTTRELKAIRGHLGMSLREFARFLRVGEASPKRWEAGLVQDDAMDELIRVKADLSAARKNVAALEARLGVASMGKRAQVIVVEMPMRHFAEPEWRAPGENVSVGEPRFALSFGAGVGFGA